MKISRQILTSLFLLFLSSEISCKKKEIVEIEEKVPPVDKEKLIASLIAPGRYWCIEGITRQVGNKIVEISEDTATFDKIMIFRIHANAYQFLNWPGDRTIFESPQESVITRFEGYDYSKGLSGKMPYGESELFVRRAYIYVGSFHGKWDWNENKHNVSVQFPNQYATYWRDGVGYLDPAMFPKYNNISEAKAAGKPERISFIVEENDKDSGRVKFAYTLRAAWIIDTLGSPRYTSKYKVLY